MTGDILHQVPYYVLMFGGLFFSIWVCLAAFGRERTRDAEEKRIRNLRALSEDWVPRRDR